ncbi:hypothetical protein JCGZ_03482 [Jatropha curcas]|uniref:PGG domain-containing protein n=1 Tax=Jatropha curcas TaxID=180498 RepID=A0A067KUR0_JATCU|nr:ankyrin repeat-containing protein BDA1 [Jatropha curcas]XP_012070101.1 ankyrin repeat-containing protein BDA1 [Jatropha curcas]XP_037491824.1 ankyrin repeat-containing protein BDA1 [Jatropha curcas]KDP39951.1 hypothetical protein JCGZ_03482 [Jatropha curcas]
MDPSLSKASQLGSIDGLYAVIRNNPNALSNIDQIPFVDTPLHIAAFAGHIQFAMEIMRLKPSFSTKSNQDGFAPIHIALQKGHIQLVLWLVEKIPDLVRVQGREGVTPLHFVAQNGNLHLLNKFLSVCPKSIEDVTIRNETALHVTLKNSQFEAFEILMGKLQQDSDEEANYWKKKILNCKDVEGNSLLHISAYRNQPQVLEFLVEYIKSNAGMLEVNALNNDGITALDLALQNSDAEVQRLLNQIIRAENILNNNIKDTTTIPNPTQIQVIKPTAELENFDPVDLKDSAEYFKFEYGKSSPEKARSDLLVVAVLMATATYQAVLTPPGTTTDKNGVTSSLDHVTYSFFMFFNSIGFYISLSSIMILINKFPLYREFQFALFAFSATYGSAVVSNSPSGQGSEIFSWIISLGMPLFILYVGSYIRILYKQRKKVALADWRRFENP